MRRTFTSALAALVAGLAVLAPVSTRTAVAQELDGKTLFKKNCSACHQLDGQGVPDAFPALAGNPFVQSDADTVAAVLLNGRGGMPNFSRRLSDRELATVLNYARGAWGNHAAEITSEQVGALRARLNAGAFDVGAPARGH